MVIVKIIPLVPPQKVIMYGGKRGIKCILDPIPLHQGPPTWCVRCGCALVLALPIPHIRWLLPIFGKLFKFFNFVPKTAAPETDFQRSPRLALV